MSTHVSAGERLDRAGAAASSLCALHCAVMPLLVTLLPLLGLSFLASEATEWLLFGASAIIGVSSLCLGFRTHRSRRALSVLAVGLALLALGRMMEHQTMHGQTSRWGVPILVCGGLIVAASHIVNRALCRACHICDHEHKNEGAT